MGFWIAPGEIEMPAVTSAMTGRTVGATTSFAVAPRTSGADGKPVLPVFGRPRKELRHKKKKHHTEWSSRASLRLLEVELKTPQGLSDSQRTSDEDPAEIKIRDWHQKHNLPWPGVKPQLPKGKVVTINPSASSSAAKLRKFRR